MAEIRERLGELKELLQKKIEECGWRIRKKTKWPIRKLQERNFKYRLKVLVKNQVKLREAEYEVEVHYCEPEQGQMLGEEDDEVEIQNDDHMEFLECSIHNKENVLEASNKTKESLDFKTNYLFKCVHAGYEELEIRQTPKFFIKEEEIALAWEYFKKEDHAQSIIAGVRDKQVQRIVLIVNREELAHEAIIEKNNSSRIKKRLYDSMSQQRTKLDIEINELWVLMNRTPIKRYIKKKKTTSHKVQLIEEDYIKKTSG